MKSTSTIPTHRRLSTMAVGAAAALIMGGFGLSAAHAETTPAAPVTASANQTASATLAENLAFSREEERLARDLYQLFADTYDQARPFSNIVKSEQRHFDAVGTLLKTYGLDDPSEGRAPGSYAEPELQKLYDEWKAQGLTSQAEALKVGIDLETRDIADLRAQIAETTEADAKRVFGNLLNGSENHLKAFTNASEGRQGGSGGGSGNGQQNGQGNGPRAGQGAGQGNRQGAGPADGTGYGPTGDRPADCPNQ